MILFLIVATVLALAAIRFRSRFLAAGATVLFVLSTPALAYAASDQPPPPATGTEAESTLVALPASTVMYVTAVLIPILGGILIRYVKSDNGKAAVGIGLNALNALITTATTEGGDAILSAPLVNNFIISLSISLATLYGFYKRVPIAGHTIDARLKGETA